MEYVSQGGETRRLMAATPALATGGTVLVGCERSSCIFVWGSLLQISYTKKMQLTGSEFKPPPCLFRSWQYYISSYGSLHLPQSGRDRFLTSWHTGQCRFLINSCNQTQPLFLILFCCQQKKKKKRILLDFEPAPTLKVARWARSDASGGEESRDGGKDGVVGWKCTEDNQKRQEGVVCISHRPPVEP